VLEAFRHVAVGDAQREAFDDGGLADAGLADQDGIVLGAARQHLDGATNLLVAADHGIELAGARLRRQVARVFLERVVAVLGARALRSAPLANLVDRGIEALRGRAGILEDAAGGAVAGQRQCEQQALRRDEAVAGFVRQLLGLVEDARQLGRHVDLTGAGAFDLRLLVERLFGRGQCARRIGAGIAQQAGRQAVLVVQQDLQKMFGSEPLMT
jgi:hypothetical protein